MHTCPIFFVCFILFIFFLFFFQRMVFEICVFLNYAPSKVFHARPEVYVEYHTTLTVHIDSTGKVSTL